MFQHIWNQPENVEQLRAVQIKVWSSTTTEIFTSQLVPLLYKDIDPLHIFTLVR